jgi:hypothetical protein
MFTTSTTTQYTFKTKDSSWELSERVSKYLKGWVFLGNKNIMVECESGGIVITALNATIPVCTLECINDNIPVWVKEIASENKNQIEEDIKEVKKFLKTFSLPKIKSTYSHKDELKGLLDIMENFLEDLKDGLKAGEPNSCRMGDLESYTQLLNLVGQKKYKEAYKVYRSLDTGEREIIPDKMHDLLLAGSWVK